MSGEKTGNRWASRTNRRGSKPKRISELAPSTFQRYLQLGKLPYYPTFRDSVRDLFEYQLSDGARLTWVRLQPLFANRLAPGYLIDERTEKPVLPEFLARIWGKDPSDIFRDLEELREFGFIGHQNGVWFDLAMVSYYENLEDHNAPNNNDLDDGPQQSRNKLLESIVEKSRGEYRLCSA